MGHNANLGPLKKGNIPSENSATGIYGLDYFRNSFLYHFEAMRRGVWTVSEYTGRQMVHQWLNFCLVYSVRIMCQQIVGQHLRLPHYQSIYVPNCIIFICAPFPLFSEVQEIVPVSLVVEFCSYLCETVSPLWLWGCQRRFVAKMWLISC